MSSASASGTSRVRSTSCRVTNAPSAAVNASTDTAPLSWTRAGRLYSTESGSSWARNHNRCCANDNGNGPPRPAGTTRDETTVGVTAGERVSSGALASPCAGAGS